MSEIARWNIAGFFATRNCRIVLLMILLAIAANSSNTEAVTLRFSGVLGQSQPIDDKALSFLSVDGVVADRKGRLWTASRGREQLLALARNDADRWVIVQRVKLPTPIFSNTGLVSDGQSFFFICDNWKVYRFDPDSGQLRSFSAIKQLGELNPRERKWMALAVTPHELLKGYAVKGKLFLLFQDQVRAFDLSGNNLDIVLKLDRPAGARWHYSSLAVEPQSGDLLVGTTWPKAIIYRFDSAGQTVTRGGWPRKRIFARRLLVLGNQAWALQQNGGAISLPLTLQKASDVLKIEPYWTAYPSGLVRDRRGHYWVGCSQGLVEFDPYRRPTKQRLGGLPEADLLAVTPDGIVLSMVEHRQRLIRLFLDDKAGAAFISNANEPFRVGFTWGQHAADMVWDGQGLLVLDKTDDQLWRWEPQRIHSSDKPWIKLTQQGQFSDAKALAVADNRFWVLDRTGVLEGALGEEESTRQIPFPEVDISRIRYLAGLNDQTVLVATDLSISAWQRQEDGGYNRVWTTKEVFGKISSVATNGRYVLVVDNKEHAVAVLAANSGRILTILTAKVVPNGMQPVAVAVHRNWIVVADKRSQRLLRFQIIK